MRDNWTEFRERGVAVFGVNSGSAASHEKFRRNHGLPFPLLVDQGKNVARLYGANGFPVVRRTVYAIDKDGRVAFAERGMPEPARILAALTARN